MVTKKPNTCQILKLQQYLHLYFTIHYNSALTLRIVPITGDVLVRMMEEKDRDTCRTLYGHSGPVYKVGFDPFKTLLLSCSEDSTGKLTVVTALCRK